MKKINKKIGIIDMNIDSIYLINAIRNMFKEDDIYYINDNNLESYEEMDLDEINDLVSKNINKLLSFNIDVLVIANDSIVEYCEELLESLTIPIVHIVNETINYINKFYEFKNIGFLACDNIIQANIYQKNFRYNHLYNMNGDNLRDLIRTQLVKTTETFQEVKNVVMPFRKKDLDIIVPSLVNYLMVETEFSEWVRKANILPIDKIITESIQNILYGKDYIMPVKGKGKTYLLLKEELDNKTLDRFIKSKYELIK